MSRISIGIFDGEAELLDYEGCKGNITEICFTEQLDGFLTLDGITVRVKEGRAQVDIRLLDEGEYEPTLILKDRRYKLPPLIKCSERLEPKDPDSRYIRDVSLRERRLSMRVRELEAKIEKITKSVYGTTLF